MTGKEYRRKNNKTTLRIEAMRAITGQVQDNYDIIKKIADAESEQVSQRVLEKILEIIEL